MFGYIIPAIPELKVREFELYRQYYCGVCRALKDRYGRTQDLAYDAAFVHILADGLTHEMTAPGTERCIAHPVRGLPALKTPSADYAADVNILMAVAKAQDDVIDTGSLLARARAALLRGRRKRAAALVPGMVAKMESCAAAIQELERNRCAQPDAAAEPYGILFGSILSDLDVVQSHVLYDIGYNTGRWVYLIDAWDDMAEDGRKNQYNVFNECMSESGRTKQDLLQSTEFSMHFTLAQAADALGRLELKKNRELLDNIVRLGMYAQTCSVLSGAGRLHESIRRSGRV